MKFNFKFILTPVILCFLTVSLLGQSKDRIRLEQEIWGKTEEQFTDNSIPEEWRDESAVIIFQDIKHRFKRKSGSYYSETTFHARIALLDKNAVKQYSEFSFSENSRGGINYRRNKEGQTVGFKVIKASGESEILDLENAVEVQTDDDNSEKKIAVPNLQKGDIIDFFYRQTDRVSINYAGSLVSYYTTLNSDYPAKYIRFRFEIIRGLFLGFKAMNGAPDLVQKESTKDHDVFEMTAFNVDKEEDIDLMYPYHSLPSIKYQFFATGRRALDETYRYKGIPNVKAEIRDKERGYLLTAIYGNSGPDFSPVSRLEAHLSRIGKDIDSMSDIEIISEFYRLHHFHLLEKTIEKSILTGEPIPLPFSDHYSLIVFRSGLKELGYEGDVLMTTSREYGDIEDVLMAEELRFILRVNTKTAGTIYIPNFTLHPNLDRIPGELEGQNAVLYPMGKIRDLRVFGSEGTDTIIDKSSRWDNETFADSEISFSEDMEELIFSTKNVYKGHNKDWYQNRLLGFYDYWEKDLEYFKIDSYNARLSEAEQEKNNQVIAEFKKDAEERIDAAIKDIISDAYATEDIEIDSFRIISDGRLGSESTDFAYLVTGKTDNLLQRAGNNYLLNAGMLIGKQREIEEKDRTRDYDIHMKCARSFRNAITVNIPEGYTVEGVEKLNTEVKNETGAFISKAVVEGNKLLIETEKWYAHNYEPVENWSKMVEFLEAAYKFTEVKVLLRKQ